MDKTLFTPAMIETFQVCRRAYQLAFEMVRDRPEAPTPGGVCKRFLLKGLAEINRGRLCTVNQVQKFTGTHWPSDKLKADEAVKAFLFAYKTLTNYVGKPYRPEGSLLAGVGLKVRARIPHNRVYLEDSFDLILWYPQERRLEFVDFHINPLKPFDEAWPPASILVKQFLAERLQCRWPFDKLSMTFCRVGTQGYTTNTIDLDEKLYRLHWTQLLKTVEEMKDPEH